MRNLFLLISVFLLTSNGYCQTAEELFKQAVSKNLSGDYIGAMSDISKVIEIRPSFSDAYQLRSAVKSNLRDYMGSIEDINKAIEINPNNAMFFASRASTKRNQKDYYGAIADLDKAIEINPNNIYYYYDRANIKAYEINDPDGAISDYTKIIEINPKSSSAYYNRGIVKIANGQKDSGCLDLSKAGELGYSSAYNEIKKYCN